MEAEEMSLQVEQFDWNLQLRDYFFLVVLLE